MIQPGMTKRKRSEHYVNNKEFLAALIEYRNDVENAFIKKYGRESLREQDERFKMGYKTTNSTLYW